jgi:integrase
MRGTIIKRGDSFRIKVSLGKNSETGKYESYFETIKGNKKDAEKRLNEVINEHEKGTFTKPGKITLADYLEQWLRDYAFPNLSPRTAEGYETIINKHLIPSLGQIPLTQLRPDTIQKYYSEMLANGRCNLKGGLSKQTVRHHYICLHTALQNAVKMGMLIRNPVDATTSPRPGHTEMHTMNEKDIHIFLEYAKSTQYYALFYTALFTGMRRSELLGLRWQDIDLLLLQISVNRSLHQLSKKRIVFRQPKTDKSRRLIVLQPQLDSRVRL